MSQLNPTDDTIRETASVMLVDSPRRYYEYVGLFSPGGREPLTILVDSTDAKALEDWRTRITTLRTRA